MVKFSSVHERGDDLKAKREAKLQEQLDESLGRVGIVIDTIGARKSDGVTDPLSDEQKVALVTVIAVFAEMLLDPETRRIGEVVQMDGFKEAFATMGQTWDIDHGEPIALAPGTGRPAIAGSSGPAPAAPARPRADRAPRPVAASPRPAGSPPPPPVIVTDSDTAGTTDAAGHPLPAPADPAPATTAVVPSAPAAPAGSPPADPATAPGGKPRLLDRVLPPRGPRTT